MQEALSCDWGTLKKGGSSFIYFFKCKKPWVRYRACFSSIKTLVDEKWSVLSKDWLHEHRKGREGDLEGDDKISRGTLRSQELAGVAVSFCVVQYKDTKKF